MGDYVWGITDIYADSFGLVSPQTNHLKRRVIEKEKSRKQTPHHSEKQRRF
jgi:hypothetical protein